MAIPMSVFHRLGPGSSSAGALATALLATIQGAALATMLAAIGGRSADAQSADRWRAHDPDRPKPVVVTPGAAVGQAPSDAIVLLDGRNLDAWTGPNGGPAKWALRDGYMETAPGAGPLQTKQSFGDVQLHIEWATPSRVEGNGQGRGNSGVIIMGLYEVQVLDSYGNQTYADGQAAAIYGQYPPQVNASRGPGEWQTYDIVFRRPRFGAGGAVRSPARLTVFHNGVLVQDGESLWGSTDWLQYRPYAAHADALPLVLQDHDNPVRYRNIWVRPLGDIARPTGLANASAKTHVPAGVLRGYAGTYLAAGTELATVLVRGGTLMLRMPGEPRRELELVAVTREHFTPRHTAGRVDFSRDAAGGVRVRLRFAEIDREGERQTPGR
jgi:hypothetical protein